MISPRESIRYQQFGINKFNTMEGSVIVEMPVSLTVNGQSWLKFMCTPVDLEALAAGFLFNENLIDHMEDIVDIQVCAHGDNIDVWLAKDIEKPKSWTRTSGCTGGFTSVHDLPDRAPTQPSSDLEPSDRGPIISPEIIHNLMEKLFKKQRLYRETGGIHTSALSNGEQIIVSAEDIGRHNSLDKVSGQCLLQNNWPDVRILLTTGRISSEMLQKSARMGASIIISRTSPSSLSIQMASIRGITLIGYARRGRFNIYTHPERIAQFQSKVSK
jgi:FdhD protein